MHATVIATGTANAEPAASERGPPAPCIARALAGRCQSAVKSAPSRLLFFCHFTTSTHTHHAHTPHNFMRATVTSHLQTGCYPFLCHYPQLNSVCQHLPVNARVTSGFTHSAVTPTELKM